LIQKTAPKVQQIVRPSLQLRMQQPIGSLHLRLQTLHLGGKNLIFQLIQLLIAKFQVFLATVSRPYEVRLQQM